MVEVRDESSATAAGVWQPPSFGKPFVPPPRPRLHAYTVLATAAFGRRDSRLSGYPAAVESARSLGFAPVLRTVGGQLAPLHPGTLVIDVVAPAQAAAVRTRDRFGRASSAICTALAGLGVPAQVGELPGEYCPGEFSVNAAGAVKLAGIAQRVMAWGFLLSVNLVVDDPGPLREVVGVCYRDLGLPVDPSRVGAVSEYLPGAGLPDVAAVLIPALTASLLRTDH